MAVTYAASLKNTRMAAVRDAIDAAATAGTLEIGTAGMAAILATITLADPASTVTADVLTLAGVPVSDTSADNTGTAAEARIKDGDGNAVVTGLTVTATGGGGDIELDNLSIEAGQEVKINSGTITHG